VCTTLAAAGHQAVTVGGAVRDAILGRMPGLGRRDQRTAEDVMALFKRTIRPGCSTAP